MASTTSENETAKSTNDGQNTWDVHWRSLGSGASRSAFGLASSVVRRLIFQPAVRYFLEKYFPPEGDFIEAGCGTGESSTGVPRRNRRFFGIDFSMAALKQVQSSAFDVLICADLFNLPLTAGSVDGIWNLGVMEHFERDALGEALGEFRRVLRPGGTVVLFWPCEANLSRWVLAPIESVRSFVSHRRFRFFPDEVSRLKSRQEALEILSASGFIPLEVDFSARTAFIHMVVVARVPSSG